jgi:hypothetical protein
VAAIVLKNVTRIKVLFCLFIYTGEVCYLIPQTPCNQRIYVVINYNVEISIVIYVVFSLKQDL